VGGCGEACGLSYMQELEKQPRGAGPHYKLVCLPPLIHSYTMCFS